MQLAALVLAAVPMLAAGAAESPDDPARLALFIGIGRYPGLPDGDLHGCSNDVEVLHALFRDRFGFEDALVLIDGAATRAGIGAAFEELLERARAAGDGPLTVLIVYAGHGGQVADQQVGEPGHDEVDALDETWIAHDSSWAGENDVRDDEVDALLDSLAALGAQVILISDSCHSGTVHRGASFARARTPRAPEGAPRERAGPQGALLPLAPAVDQAVTRGGPDARSEPRPGFVVLTACADRGRAYEHVDAEARPRGRFAWMLGRVLSELPAGSTYEDLYRRLLAGFAVQWPDRLQTPQMHASAAKRGEVFLAGGYPPPHAAIVPGSMRGHRARLTAGQLHGVTPTARFEFYADLDELEARRAPLGSAAVTAVDLDTCAVELDAGVTVPPTAVARLDAVRMTELTVALAPGVPESAAVRVRALAADGRIALAGPDEPHDVAVHPVDGGRVALYGPAAQPSARSEGGAASAPAALWAGTETGPETSAVELALQLEHMAIARRLMTLTRDEGSVELALERTAAQSASTPEWPLIDGVMRLTDGELVTLRFRNRTRRRLYLHMLTFDTGADGVSRAQVLLPAPGEEPEAVGPGEELALAEFRASAESELERTTLKLFAADAPLSLHALLRTPVGVTRGGSQPPRPEDPLLSLLSIAVHGGGRTRGQLRQAPSLYWSTTELVFEVVRTNLSRVQGD